jgi:hypothetical protein
MAKPRIAPWRTALSGPILKGVSLLSILVFPLLFPSLVLLGGSTNLLNWGPGFLFAGLACLLLLDQDRKGLQTGAPYSACLLGLLGLLLIRARFSPDVAATADNSALLGFAAAGYLIGKLAGTAKSQMLFLSLSLVAILHLGCSIVQMADADWNLIYPRRSAAFPCGLFAHYNHSTAFCLATIGLLAANGCRESGWKKALCFSGAICAIATIPLSLSRGGNLALALMAATASALLLARAYSNSKSLLNTWLPAITLMTLLLIFGSFLVPMIGRATGPSGFYGDGIRVDFWKAAMELASHQPWIGGGPANFTWNVFHVMDGLRAEPVLAHNEALQVAADYGYPALIAIAAVITIPMLRCFWRFANRDDPTYASWAAVGLVGMLFQSNFDFIFHSGPGAFLAALILGQMARGVWPANLTEASVPTDHQSATPAQERGFLLNVSSQASACLADPAPSIAKLAALLSQSADPQWRRGAYRLTYWSKIGDPDALRNAIQGIESMCASALARISPETCKASSTATVRNPRWSLLAAFAVAVCAIPIVWSGAARSLALIQAWAPLYHPQSMPAHERFERLLEIAESQPGLGIDRKILSEARECIYEYQSQEAREYFAKTYRLRILRALPAWRVDPGASLLLAELVGWTGDFQSALDYYNHAISTQGNNELLFMAHAFKGQYFYELCISAGAAGQTDQQQLYARQAVECFQNSIAECGDNPAQLDASFRNMLRECESLRNGSL